MMDVFSRKIVAWEARDSESSEHTSVLICKACLRKGVQEGDCVPHLDNGNPMKGQTMLVILQKLGVILSFSSPSVSDENPYSESFFKMLKHKFLNFIDR